MHIRHAQASQTLVGLSRRHRPMFVVIAFFTRLTLQPSYDAPTKGGLMRRLLVLFIIAVFPAISAAAQTAPAAPAPYPACDGDIAIVRVSQIKPGAMAGFMKAIEAHKAWYRSHGYMNNEIYGAKVIAQDPATKTRKYSDAEVMTFHVRPPNLTGKPDAAWDAYVKQYRDTSDIKSETTVCMPKTK